MACFASVTAFFALWSQSLARTGGEHSSGLFRDFSRLFGTFGAVLFPSRVRALSPSRSANTEIQRVKWSERGDLNSRPPVPQTGALTELRYAPSLKIKHFSTVPASTKREMVT